jgi:hypothetical protein
VAGKACWDMAATDLIWFGKRRGEKIGIVFIRRTIP